VLGRSGKALVSWEHTLIPKLIKQIPNSPAVPDWPKERFDIVWVLDHIGETWKFSQIPQMLLAGDSKTLIT
jgi:hypothetical protein